MPQLSNKQQKFVSEYLKDFNATQAAIRAGYTAKNADVVGPRLLGNVGVKALVAKAQEKAAEKSQVTVERVLKELAAVAFSDIREAFNPDGSLRPVHEMPESVARALAGVEVMEMAGGASISPKGGIKHVPMFTKKIKLWSKTEALEALGRHLGMFKDKLELSGSVNMMKAVGQLRGSRGLR